MSDLKIHRPHVFCAAPHVGQVIFATGQKWMLSQQSEDVSIAAQSDQDFNQPCKHIFSCEIASPFQDWILSAHNPQVLVADLEDMHKTTVFDLRTKTQIITPKVTAVFCGWVCHTA